ncbi:EAL domain-containing protein [Oleiagrimonas soli]|uniref:Diguanylate cyclase DosC n=1 Tax=Oleiagrimonas soli TaxID=1543381 RepID=A0A099CYH9_9GAMM|nr:EAL domain-containing protein [Oleiagrimonas soli]KGI78667.1 hypothetical protein LF63_0104330 [Oleiagrimonas soli]MBB6184022.1 diguanylate cyclase (GGDEF)-like protein/PAS domain S-box-containing protein [Oleiagrimonas soli]
MDSMADSQVSTLLDLQRELLAVVARPGALRQRLDQLCLLIEHALDGWIATVMQLDHATGRLRFVSVPTAPDDLLAQLDQAQPGDGHGSCAYAAWKNQPTYVSNATQDPHWAALRDVAVSFGVHSCWSTPVHDRAQNLVGTFALTSLRAGPPGEYQQHLLELGAIGAGLIFDQENEALLQTAEERAARRLALVTGTTPNGIMFTDAHGNIEWVNAGALELLERTAADIVGKNLCAVLDQGAETPELKQALQAVDSGESFAGTLRLRRPSGKTWAAQITCTPRHTEHSGTTEGAVVMLIDVSALQRLSEFNLLLAHVDTALSRINDPGELLQLICDLTIRHAGLSLVWIGRPNAETGWFEAMAAAGPDRDYLDAVKISSNMDLPEGRGPCGLTWNDGQSRFDCSFEETELKPWAEPAREWGFAAIAVLPIHRAGRLWALLCVYHSELHSFDPTLQYLLQTLSMNISSGLDRIDLADRERESQALNQSMLESATVGVVLTRNNVVLHANRRAAEILGAADAVALEGHSASEFYDQSEHGRWLAEQTRRAFDNDRRAIIEIPARRMDGERIWLRLEGAPFHHQDYDEIWSLIDQTEQHRAMDQQELMANALASVQEGVIITDTQQRIVYINQAFRDLTGYDFGQVRGGNYSLLQGPETDKGTIRRIHATLQDESEFVGDILNYRKDGSTFWSLLTINPLRDSQGCLSHYVWVQRDITDLRRLTARMEYLAFHDELTGLPNRRALEHYLADALPRAMTDHHVIAVAIIDLDDFKIINDTHGHVTGDHLLNDLAQAIKPQLTEHDFFARLGSDEFVVVFHESSPRHAEHRLQKRFASIGQCLRTPFDAGSGQSIYIGLSMGVALAPRHATEGGMLLRLADEALLKAKRHKLERANWWSIHGEVDDQEAFASIAPYGKDAADVLDAVHPHLTGTLKHLVESFYALVLADPHAGRLLGNLHAGDVEHLKKRQLAHMQLLTAASATRKNLIEASQRAGRIHALIGIDSVLLIRWMSVYHENLTRQCNTLPISKRLRHSLVQLLDHRLQDDMQAQLEAQTNVQDRYAAIIDQFMPDRGSGWNDAISLEVRLLARLPGMTGVMVLRQSGSDTYNIEYSAGSATRAIATVLAATYGVHDTAHLAPPEESLLSKAWHTAKILTCPALNATDTAIALALPPTLARIDVRAASCIPVMDEQHLPVALLLLLGHYPNQFESKQMQHFLRNLQLRGNEIWQRSMRPSPPVSYEQAAAFRRRLFKDGLCMLLQPIVDLHTGRLIKVEALARLTMENGALLGPDIFLPLLRNAELDTLFQRGLDMALGDLVALERQGLHINLTLNISPHTLAEPECRAWVSDALERHGVPPQRLFLEILENQRVDRQARDDGVRRLVELGVRFAIDDLGSGYSSLRRLASLPFDAVKVDQDLLARLHIDPVQSITLISAVVQIGRDFGCEVIAEGLEDSGMIEVAQMLGAGMGQGYAIARPMKAAELPDWNRQFTLDSRSYDPKTPLGGLTFQWISLRHESLHTAALEDCPLTRLMECSNRKDIGDARSLHAAVHDDPNDRNAARRLLDWMQACIRGPLAEAQDGANEKGPPD